MWLMKYECEYIKNMEWVELYKICIKPKNSSYLAAPDNGQLNQWNNEFEQWSMNVSESKLWNGSNK